MESMAHGSRTSRRTPKRKWLALRLLAVPALAVAAVLFLSQHPEPFPAEVVGGLSQTNEGTVADLRWIDEAGVAHTQSFNLTEEQITSGTVLLVDTEDRVSVYDPSAYSRLSAVILAVTAVVAFLFAVVVEATVHGFGFVRGTGKFGEMTPDDVEESHAFYWRH